MSTYTDTDYTVPKSAAEIQREIELQRSRVENTIDQIQDRLSPGQLVDELLTYTKNGGGEFAAGLGRVVMSNPLPVALLGVSLVWLMAGPSKRSPSKAVDRWRGDRSRSYQAYDYAGDEDVYDDYDDLADYDDETDYPYAPIQGSSLRRSYHGTDESTGSRVSEFVDEAGKKFRAASDEVGNRAGHFRDEAGNMYRGFTDSAGNRIQNFMDEAGSVLSDASGWASDTWAKARRALNDGRDAISRGASSASSGVSGAASRLSSGASYAGRGVSRAGRGVSRASVSAGRKLADVGSNVSTQGARAARSAASTLQEQPMVTGALAFAVGAAVAALLPHTRQEDELLGDTADQVKAEASRKAADLYQTGREQVSSLYSEASNKAGDLYQQATEKAGEVYGQAKAVVEDQAASLVDTARNATQAAASDVEEELDDSRDLIDDNLNNRDQARNI